MEKKPVIFAVLKERFPLAYAALEIEDLDSMSLEDFYEETDATFYTYNEELYLESHDEASCSVWREGAFVEIAWEDRPIS